MEKQNYNINESEQIENNQSEQIEEKQVYINMHEEERSK